MEWLELHIDTNHAGLEPLEIFLSANGVDGVVIDDEQDFQNFLENNHQYWDYVDEDLDASRSSSTSSQSPVLGLCGRGSGSVHEGQVPDHLLSFGG